MCFAAGMEFSPPEASSFSHSIFSPLTPKQATNLPIPQYHSTAETQFKSAEFSEVGGPHSAGASPSTLSPLTISARDIDGGSADFTEFCAGSLSFSDGDDLHATPRNTSEKPCYAGIPSISRSLGQDSVNFFSLPNGTSSPSVPVRVRVSANKLREIHSPHSSVASTSAVFSQVAESLCRMEGNTPRALSQPTEEIRNQKCRASILCVCDFICIAASTPLCMYKNAANFKGLGWLSITIKMKEFAIYCVFSVVVDTLVFVGCDS